MRARAQRRHLIVLWRVSEKKFDLTNLRFDERVNAREEEEEEREKREALHIVEVSGVLFFFEQEKRKESVPTRRISVRR